MKEGGGWGIISRVDASIVKEVEIETEIASALNDCVWDVIQG